MIRTVCGTGCGVYSNQHMNPPSVGNLPGGSQIFVNDGQRIRVGARYAVPFQDGAHDTPLYFGMPGAIFWVYEDLLM
jgi:hypothetical protein